MIGRISAAVWLLLAWTFLWYALIRPALRHHRAVKVWRRFHIRYLIRTHIHPGAREADTL